MEETQTPVTLWDILGRGREGVLNLHLPALVEALEWVAAAVDLIAVAVMLLGAARFFVKFLSGELARRTDQRVARIDGGRMELGRYILAALELLIVSDIIHTSLSLALVDLLYLGLLVVIRSAIAYFLDREIEGLRGEVARSEGEDAAE